LLRSDILTAHYQIEVTRTGRMDDVTVRVEAQPGAADPVLLDTETKSAVARIKHHVGLTVTLIIQSPGTIERSVGKAKRVLDHRPKE